MNENTNNEQAPLNNGAPAENNSAPVSNDTTNNVTVGTQGEGNQMNNNSFESPTPMPQPDQNQMNNNSFGSPTPMPQPDQNQMNYTEEKKKSPLLIIVILIILVLGGVLFFFKDKLFTTAYKLMSNEVTTYLKKQITEVNDIFDMSKPLLESGNVTLSTDIEEFKFINDYKLDYKLGLDVSKNQALVGLGISEKDKSLLAVDALSKENKVYIKVPEVLSNIYYLDAEINLTEMLKDGSNNEDIEYLLDVAEKAINEALKEGYKTEKATIKINGSDVNVTDTYYNLSGSESKDMSKRASDVFKNDSKAISILAKMSGQTEEEVKKLFETSNGSVNETSTATVRFDIYTKGILKKVVGIKLSDDTDVVEYVFDNDYSKFTFTADGMTLTAETKSNVTDVKYTDGTNNYSGTVTKKSDNEYTYNFDLPGIKVSGSISNTESGNTQTCKFDLKLAIDELGSINITSNTNLEKNANIEIFDISKALDFNNITEEDFTNLMTKVEELLNATGLNGLLEGAMM